MNEIIQSKIGVLPPTTSIGCVTLLVKNLASVLHYYKDGVGLNELIRDHEFVVLGYNNHPILKLIAMSDLPFADLHTAGLYHIALVFESKAVLAQSLRNIFSIFPDSYRGSGDHLVSEAFYFEDPEGNGLELYVDRPRNLWQWNNGRVKMDTLYIDAEKFIDANLKEIGKETSLSVGHIHLKVGDIQKAYEFYVEQIGFEVTAEMPSALFVSAGGYHHHIGMNTWQSLHAPKRSNSLGLGSFEILLTTDTEIEEVRRRLENHVIPFHIDEQGIQIKDPWDNALVITKR